MENLARVPCCPMFPDHRNHLSCREKAQKKEKNRGVFSDD
jgi:hypothetical protein